MKQLNANFIVSAEKLSQCPPLQLPEFPMLGRSNVGKSSFINALANNKKLAKTSNTPGKTRLINFFNFSDIFTIADLPGYGYAKVSKKEKESWGKTIETYLTDRDELKRVILLVDSRHKPTADDIMMYEWIKHFDYDCIVIATKSDKLSNNELGKSRKLIKETLGLGSTDKFYFFSSLNKKGKDELIDNIFEDLSEEAK